MGQLDRFLRQIELSAYIRRCVAEGQPIDTQKVFDGSAADISEFKSRTRRSITGQTGAGQPACPERSECDRERPEGRPSGVTAVREEYPLVELSDGGGI